MGSRIVSRNDQGGVNARESAATIVKSIVYGSVALSILYLVLARTGARASLQAHVDVLSWFVPFESARSRTLDVLFVLAVATSNVLFAVAFAVSVVLAPRILREGNDSLERRGRLIMGGLAVIGFFIVMRTTMFAELDGIDLASRTGDLGLGYVFVMTVPLIGATCGTIFGCAVWLIARGADR